MITTRAPFVLHSVFLTTLGLAVFSPRVMAANPEPVDSQTVLRSLEDAFVAVADRVTPAVVNVSVKGKRVAQESEGPEREERFKEFFGPEFFERFFRRRQPREDPRAM